MKRFIAITMTFVIMAGLMFNVSACNTNKYIKNSVISTITEHITKNITRYTTKTKNSIQTITEQKTSDPYVAKNLGTFSLTFYIPDAKWGYSTSTGVRSQHLATCAVDPRVIPYGSVIKIVGNNGQTLILKAVDCGGGIKGNKIDIFWDKSISEGYAWMAEFGTIHNVYLLEE